MKIIIKTVKVVIGEFEVQPEQTILQLKQQIAEHENVTVECISLIYKSKMLKDDTQTLEQVKVQDGDNIVIVLKKAAQTAKPAPKPVEQPKPAEPTPAPVEQPKPVEQAPAPQPTPAGPAQQGVNIFQEPPKPAQQQAAEPSEENVQMLMGMGFGREESTKALRKTRDNVEIAANLLLEGANLDNIPDPQAQPAQGAAPAGGLGGMLGTKEEFIREVQANPEQFEILFQQIEQQSQQMGMIARNNPGVLYDILVQSMGAAAGGYPQQQQQPPRQPQYQPAPQAAPQPAAGSPQLTAADEEAIGRLQQLGFSRNQCIQAYLVTDKNELLAANFLLDGMI